MNSRKSWSSVEAAGEKGDVGKIMGIRVLNSC